MVLVPRPKLSAPHEELPFDAFAHPADEAALACMISGMKEGDQLRVRGSLHSEHGSVLGERANATQVMLDRLTQVDIDVGEQTAEVGAGVSLGGDPVAPSGAQPNPQGVLRESLCEQLARKELALPLTGGITHQTISGFMSSAADGGSLVHTFWSSVEGFTLIDGTGQKHRVRRGEELFEAGASSLGLLGVISSVSLKLEPSYEIFGMRSVQPERGGDFDLFADSSANGPTLVDFLRDKPYARALWWPQPGVERVELWEAERYDPKLHDARSNGRTPPAQERGVPTPALQLLLRALLTVLSESTEANGEADQAAMGQALAGNWRALIPILRRAWDAIDPRTKERLGWREFELVVADLIAWLTDPKRGAECLYPELTGAAPAPASRYGALSMQEQVVAAILNQFVPMSPSALVPWLDTHKVTRRQAGQLFKDPWHRGLPMDNPIDDRLLPVTFTELWLPLERAHLAMQRMSDMFLSGRLARTGTFCVELYAAKQNAAWLSMAHGGDVFRVDPFYFDQGDVAARDRFFQAFWDELLPLGACPHWGKALPPPGTYDLHSCYPALARFLALRRQLDPKDLFVTEYWKTHLGI